MQDMESDTGYDTRRHAPDGALARMSPSSNDTGRADPTDPGSEQRLLNRVRRGSSSAAPQYQQRLHDEMWGRYREGLKRLKVRDRRLIVGRAELAYNYEQLAAIERLPSPDAARKALKRAVIRLSAVMPLASSR